MTTTRHRTANGSAVFASAAILVSYLPFSAVNGVLGTIGADTGAGFGALQSVTEAFTVALAAAVLSGGALATRYGGRVVAVLGLTLTTLACLVGWLAGTAGTVPLLWLGQGVAGIGAGLVMSATLSLIAATAPSPSARTRAIAIWAAGTVVGLGAGPFLSGTISGALAWQWLFPPLAVLAALTATFGLVKAHDVAATSARLDVTGQLLGTLGVIALVYGVTSGGDAGWTSSGAFAGLGAGGTLLAAFLFVEHRAANPVLRPALFASRGFTAAGLGAAVALFTVVGVVFVASLFLARQGVSDLGIAERIGCLFAGNALASVATSPLQRRFGARAVLLGGLAVTAAGLVALFGVDESTGLAGMAWRFAIVGAGCGAVVATSTSVAVQAVPAALGAMAGTANNVLRQLGGALGAAVVGNVLVRQLAAGASPASAIHTCVGVLLVVVTVTSAAAALLLVRPTTH